MIARQYRFHGYGALNFVYKQGRTARSQSCLLRFCANPRRTDCRMAVVVSKKVHKSAVGRNRIRRRIFGVVQSLEQGIGDWPAYDMVFTVVDDAMLEMPKKTIENTILKLLQVLPGKPQTVDK